VGSQGPVESCAVVSEGQGERVGGYFSAVVLCFGFFGMVGVGCLRVVSVLLECFELFFFFLCGLLG